MWLVIGYGSSLHSDDAVGLIAAQQVEARTDDRQVRILTAVQLTPELAQPVSGAEGVIFLDAGADVAPGRIDVQRLSPMQAAGETSSGMTHQCSPTTLLQSAELLYGHAPPAWIYAIGGAEYGLGETLSPPVASVLPELVRRVLTHLQTGLPTQST